MEKKKRLVLVDPKTGMIISDPQSEKEILQKKIREAALVDKKISVGDSKLWNVLHGKPQFNENQSAYFFSEMTELIWEYKTLMDKNEFIAEVQSGIDEKLERANKRVIEIIHDLGIRHQKKSRTLFANKKVNSLLKDLQAEIRMEMEKCLKAPANRMKVEDGDGKDLLNKVVCMNPRSDVWQERENELIKKIALLYDKYTPLKNNILRKSHNLVLIFNACGISNIGVEALRKRISDI
jgi:hypothetical protein